jgi:probable rRNA maturation factor
MAVEVELAGGERLPDGPDVETVERLCRLAFAAAGVEDGHAAVAIVDEDEIGRLNREHRGKDSPTDVLSFPLDGAEPTAGPRELGDIVICPPLCESVTRAIVHGALHLVGMDHEVDGGEMLAVEAEILRWEAN